MIAGLEAHRGAAGALSCRPFCWGSPGGGACRVVVAPIPSRAVPTPLGGEGVLREEPRVDLGALRSLQAPGTRMEKERWARERTLNPSLPVLASHSDRPSPRVITICCLCLGVCLFVCYSPFYISRRSEII